MSGSPFLTRSPSCLTTSLMTPPSGFWIITFWPAAATTPEAMTALVSGAVTAHVPKPPTKSTSVA